LGPHFGLPPAPASPLLITPRLAGALQRDQFVFFGEETSIAPARAFFFFCAWGHHPWSVSGGGGPALGALLVFLGGQTRPPLSGFQPGAGPNGRGGVVRPQPTFYRGPANRRFCQTTEPEIREFPAQSTAGLFRLAGWDIKSICFQLDRFGSPEGRPPRWYNPLDLCSRIARPRPSATLQLISNRPTKFLLPNPARPRDRAVGRGRRST